MKPMLRIYLVLQRLLVQTMLWIVMLVGLMHSLGKCRAQHTCYSKSIAGEKAEIQHWPPEPPCFPASLVFPLSCLHLTLYQTLDCLDFFCWRFVSTEIPIWNLYFDHDFTQWKCDVYMYRFLQFFHFCPPSLFWLLQTLVAVSKPTPLSYELKFVLRVFSRHMLCSVVCEKGLLITGGAAMFHWLILPPVCVWHWTDTMKQICLHGEGGGGCNLCIWLEMGRGWPLTSQLTTHHTVGPQRPSTGLTMIQWSWFLSGW